MYKSILLPIDLNETDGFEKALATAMAEARLWQAQLHVLAVLPNFGMPVVGSFFPADFEKNALAKMKAELEKFVADYIDDDLKAKAHLAHGVVYEEIIEAAKKLKTDLIVLAAHRSNVEAFLLGSNAAKVVRHVNCSVVVVRD